MRVTQLYWREMSQKRKASRVVDLDALWREPLRTKTRSCSTDQVIVTPPSTPREVVLIFLESRDTLEHTRIEAVPRAEITDCELALLARYNHWFHAGDVTSGQPHEFAALYEKIVGTWAERYNRYQPHETRGVSILAPHSYCRHAFHYGQLP